MITGRTCQLVRCLAEYFTTYYHRQQRGALYDGAYITIIGRALGHLHQDTLDELSDPVDPVRYDRRALFGMKIVRGFPGVGLRFSLVRGVIWAHPPLQMMDVDEGQGVGQRGEGVDGEGDLCYSDNVVIWFGSRIEEEEATIVHQWRFVLVENKQLFVPHGRPKIQVEGSSVARSRSVDIILGLLKSKNDLQVKIEKSVAGSRILKKKLLFSWIGFSVVLLGILFYQ
ncbi:hypothetical protein R6Q57_014182 [Mikania cordata]